MFSKILVFALLNVFSALCNFSLVPSQVLLPRTSVYTSKRTHQPITVNTQIPLKIEPTLCVIWKIQDPQLLAFDKSNYTHPKSKVPGDSQDFEPYTPHELKNCLPSVVINTVPLNFKTDTLYNLEKNIKNIKNEKNEKKITPARNLGWKLYKQFLTLERLFLHTTLSSDSTV